MTQMKVIWVTKIWVDFLYLKHLNGTIDIRMIDQTAQSQKFELNFDI